MVITSLRIAGRLQIQDKQKRGGQTNQGSLRRLGRVSIYLTRLFLLILIIVIEGRKRGFSNAIERAAGGCKLAL